MLLLLALALAAARPLPDPSDLQEGERATQCILLYRLRTPDVPTDSAGCEDAGYGLEFMRERDGEVRAVEQRHAEELAKAREKSRARAQAKAQRAALEEPCKELVLGKGRGPDGGAELCALAGWTPSQVAAKLSRERGADLRRTDPVVVSLEIGAGLLALGLGGVALLRLRRRGPGPS